jgi:hypothetical protein
MAMRCLPITFLAIVSYDAGRRTDHPHRVGSLKQQRVQNQRTIYFSLSGGLFSFCAILLRYPFNCSTISTSHSSFDCRVLCATCSILG